MSKKKEQKIEIKGAAKEMEKIHLKGYYKAFKQLSHEVECVKNEMKKQLPGRSKVYDKPGVIAKFQSFNLYKTDYQGLNEYLMNYGILQEVVSIDQAHLKKTYGEEEGSRIVKKLEPFRYPNTYYIQMFPNKNGKVQTVDHDCSMYRDHELPAVWRALKEEVDVYDQYIEQAKKRAVTCRDLKKQGSMACHFGSISRIPNAPTYNIHAIMNSPDFGSDFLIEAGKAKMGLIDGFVEQGIIEKKEIEPFRQIVDIRSRFIVMTLESHQKQTEMLTKKIHRMARAYREKWEMARKHA